MNAAIRPLSLLSTFGLALVALVPQSAEAAVLDVCASGCSYSTLSAAVQASMPGDTLELADETFTGGFTIDHDLTLRPMNGGMPTIDGGPGNNVLRIKSGTVVLESLEITGGTAKSGIKNMGTLILDGTYVLDNDCIYGGVWNLGTLIVTGNSVFAGNSSTSFFSGGITNLGGDVSIELTTFLANDGYNGGAMSNLNGTAAVESTSFTANSGYLGGAVHNSFGDLEIFSSSFSSNFATSLGGGWSNHNLGGTVTTSNVGYANNSTGSGSYPDCYDVNGAC